MKVFKSTIRRDRPPFLFPFLQYFFQKRGVQLSRIARSLTLGVFAMGVAIVLSCFPIQSLSQVTASNTVQPPLSTRGSQIVDATGRAVLLRGVNWFGLETETQAPHGLWARDYKEMLTQIHSLGYNVIRLPYSVQGLRSASFNGVDFSIGSNRDLEGKTPLEVMDLVIQEAQRQGLMILLDSHRLNNQRIPELWYGDGFTEDDWINTWTMLATRYRNQPNVIGADLKNEPHGRASWGTGDRTTDWRLAAERAGNAILQVNPNWLIVVEGVEKNVPGQRLTHWWGGNLEGVRRFPVRLSNPRKLVYSPHEYGAGVIDQPWFAEPSFPQNLLTRWETGFHYIARQRIAPILIGEFGGRQVDSDSKEGIWQRQFVDFIARNNLSFTYWSWNPNSADTGGILLDDWRSIDQPKQQLLNRLVPVPSIAVSPTGNPFPLRFPTSTPTPIPTPTVPTPSTPPTTSTSSTSSRLASRLRVDFDIQSDWQSGFCVSFRITNPGNMRVTNWRLSFEMNQAAITQSWNGTFNRQGSRYVVEPANWANPLEAGRSMDMGFCANKQGSDYLPRSATVIGS